MMGTKPRHFASFIHVFEVCRPVPAFVSVVALALDVIQVRGASCMEGGMLWEEKRNSMGRDTCVNEGLS